MEDLDLHVADAQLAALVPDLTMLPHSVGGIVLEHVHLQRDGYRSVWMSSSETSFLHTFTFCVSP